jgi:hypothetical protein
MRWYYILSIVLGVLIAITFIFLLVVALTHPYYKRSISSIDYGKDSRLIPTEQCLHFSEKCWCFGLTFTLASYPGWTECTGLEFCRDMDYEWGIGCDEWSGVRKDCQIKCEEAAVNRTSERIIGILENLGNWTYSCRCMSPNGYSVFKLWR